MDKRGNFFWIFFKRFIGDCTCAGVYHARQIWTLNTGTEDTQPDANALALYEAVGGYNPSDPSTDQGANEQTVLSYLLQTGAPLADGTTDKITAFFEVDPRNQDDIKTVINECGVCYIGFDVPEGIDETPGATWTLDENAAIEGGHCVILVGYTPDYFICVSWGNIYKMEPSFFSYYTDEAYALVDSTWIAKTGKTPLGLSQQDLEKMMIAIRES